MKCPKTTVDPKAHAGPVASIASTIHLVDRTDRSQAK